jgi:hypothetical protein
VPEDGKWTILENTSPRLQMTTDLFDRIDLRTGDREQIGDGRTCCAAGVRLEGRAARRNRRRVVAGAFPTHGDAGRLHDVGVDDDCRACLGR